MNKKEYYRKNIKNWQKGGKYYRYKPKEYHGELVIKKGIFVITFD
jgi:hypothetical protein